MCGKLLVSSHIYSIYLHLHKPLSHDIGRLGTTAASMEMIAGLLTPLISRSVVQPTANLSSFNRKELLGTRPSTINLLSSAGQKLNLLNLESIEQIVSSAKPQFMQALSAIQVVAVAW